MTSEWFWFVTFWCSLAAVVWPFAVYPATLALLPKRPVGTGPTLPTVTLLISAYNEEAVIAEKLENALALDYPAERLDVLVVSDASTDRTDEIVAGYARDHVRLVRSPFRDGKSAGLTRAVPEATGEILVFSDANSIYAPDALRRLVSYFADPRIGYVVGHQRYHEENGRAADSESVYWSIEARLKSLESRVGSVVGGDGAIYAVRAELFEPLRPDDISDFTLPLKIVARGYRGIFEKDAICYERPAGEFAGEFRRRVRIVARSLRAVFRVPQASNPFRVGVFAYQLVSHKILRWFGAVFLGLLAVASVRLAAGGHPIYEIAVDLQCGFYAAAVLGIVPGLRRIRPLYLASYFVLMNLAALIGVGGVLSGRRFAVWTPERPETSLDPVSTSPIKA